MSTITLPYDPAEDLGDPRDQAAILAEAFASGEAKYITVALGAVARARGMSTLAEQTGRSRPALYRALGEDGDPQLSTLLSVVAALGFKLALSQETGTQAHTGTGVEGVSAHRAERLLHSPMVTETPVPSTPEPVSPALSPSQSDRP